MVFNSTEIFTDANTGFSSGGLKCKIQYCSLMEKGNRYLKDYLIKMNGSKKLS